MKIPSKNFKLTRAERKVLADFYTAMLDKQFSNLTTDDICDILDSIKLWEQSDTDKTFKIFGGLDLTFELEDY